MVEYQKIGFGGGCHWCTEAVFQSLKGISKVDQGFIASYGVNASFSEAVVVHFDENIISRETLIAIHLYTHESTSKHILRSKYRSAIYVFNEEDKAFSIQILKKLQNDFKKELITQVIDFKEFKYSDALFHNYYYSNTEKPFCKRYIHPKLQMLLEKFSTYVNEKTKA